MTRSILETIGSATKNIPSNPQVANLVNLFGMVKNAQNPSQMMSAILQKNPMMSRVNTLIEQYNGNAEQAFYALAQQMGVDPQSILSMLR